MADQSLVRVLTPTTSLAQLGGPSDDEKLVSLWLYGRTPGTEMAYRADVAGLRLHAGKPFREMTLRDLQDWARSTEQLKPATRARRIGAVRSLFKFAHQVDGGLPTNPAATLRAPKHKDRLSERILTKEQVHRLIAAAPAGADRALIRLLYLCGLRISEACELTWRDMTQRQSGGIANVFGKGSKTRQVLVPAALWRDLVALQSSAEPTAPVIPSRHGKALDRFDAHLIVKHAVGRAGLPVNVSAHWLRHSHVSHALDAGCGVHVVQATVGHASLATTSRYTHVRPNTSSSTFLKG